VRVRIRSAPKTDVWLGRRHLGATPLRARLPRGQHVLLLRNRELGIRARRRVKLAGTTQDLRLVLKRGTLRFRVRRGQHILLDGETIGHTPLGPVRVYEGQHTVTVIDPFRYRRDTFRVTVRPGRPTWVSQAKD
jgi:hypothetical protein